MSAVYYIGLVLFLLAIGFMFSYFVDEVDDGEDDG